MPAKANVSRRRTSPKPAWIERAREGEGAKYLAISAALARAIEAGELSSGERLPPQRALAEALGVDLTTITRAYAQARAMGLLDGETGRGTFVRASGSADGPVVDLSMNAPPPPRDLSLRDLIADGLADLMRKADPATLMSYRAGMGSRRDRLAAASWLAPRLGEIALENIFIAPGAQSALAALLPLVARAGEIILAEPLTYPGFIAAANLLNIKTAPMLCDEEGPIPGALIEACKKNKPRALYLIPSLQNPTARSMSEARRVAVVEIARKFDLQIIEDDAYGAFLPHASPLLRLAPERVFFISTLSKCLAPGLRTAFVIGLPGVDIGEALRANAMMPTPLLSDLATHWIEEGTAAKLFKAVKAESAARMKLARSILPARAKGETGFHLWLSLPRNWRLDEYSAAARASGVLTVSSESFALTPDAELGIRISLGMAADRKQLAKGLKAITDLESA